MTKEEIFAANLRRLLHQKHLSPLNLAHCLHYAESTVKRWVNGERIPNSNNIARLMDFFKLSSPDIFFSLHIQQNQQLSFPLPKPEQKNTIMQISAKAKEFILTYIKDIEALANDTDKIKQFDLFVMDGFKSHSACMDDIMQNFLG